MGKRKNRKEKVAEQRDALHEVLQDTNAHVKTSAPRMPNQKWRQKSSWRFDTYELAKAFFNTLPEFKETTDGKKRIRFRPEGYFNVCLYEYLPPKVEKPVEKPEEVAA